MRSMILFGLFVTLVPPSLLAQEPSGDGALELRADKLDLRLDGAQRGVVTFDAVTDPVTEDGGGKPVRLRVRHPADAFVLLDESRSLQATRRWLGVQLADVPAALRAHLGLEEDHGVMVLNIVKDSPADEAGMKQYDVVTRLGGHKVEGGVRKFAESISQLEEGAEVELEVIQGGDPRKMKIAPSARPADGSAEFKFDLSDGVELDHFEIRGAVGEPGPDGWKFRWTEKPGVPFLGQIPHLGRMFITEGHGQATIERGDKTIRVTVEDRNGKRRLVVVREESADGKPREVTIYKDLDELKEKDSEVYDVARRLLDGKSSHGQVLDWIKKKSDGKVLSRKLWRQWKPDEEEVEFRSASDEADRLFKVENDGRIRVVIKRGKSQVEIDFENEREMKEKEPKLYAHYKNLLGG